jgi:CSLREA domain-containing protein
MIRSLLCGFLSILTLLGVATTAVAGNGAEKVTLTGPKAVEQDVSSALTLKLPGRVRAVSGRVLYDTSAVELIGIAPKGKGEVLSPDDVQGGSAFATYGLKAKGATVLRIVFVAHVSGRIQFNVVLDSMATGPGARTTVSSRSLTTTVSVGSGSRFYGAPTAAPASAPRLAATSMARDLNGDGLVGQFDLDNVRAAWAASGDTCAAVDASADANADGCVDVVDMQDVTADSGSVVGTLRASGDTARLMTSSTSTANTSNSKTSTAKAAKAVANAPFVVNSTADTPDAKNGDGICADSRGRCTLRAAITESNWQKGANTINFNISGAGSAPVVIQMTSNMSLIQDKTGGTTIDGYTQPGAHVNTATVGSNAIPGIELRGLTSDNKRDNGFFITSANNVIRGFVMNDHYRSFYTDTDEAHDNYIVGNWIGFNANGSNQAHRGANGIRINTGSTANHIGTSNLADRNVIGNYTHPIDFYGPTTRANFVQGNVLCMTPSGMATAYCATGIDHNFGPKDNLEGGPNPGDRNVIGGTTLNGIEISHGWDPDTRESTAFWKQTGNQIIGNWIGFRGDGSYNAAFLSGQNTPNSNDANGVNVYDGSSYNLVQGNYIGARWDGINTMSPTSTGNVFRNNVIGLSPLGQAAPIGRYGINVRTSTKTGLIEGNEIHNAAVYGIGLTNQNVMWFTLSKNIITDMSGPAIYEAPNPNKPSTGANNLLAPPVITSATTSRASGTGIKGATVEVYRASRNSAQSGLPVEYLGSGLVGSDGKWSVNISTAQGNRVVALQTNAAGNTSVLGTNVTVGQQQGPVVVAQDDFARTVTNSWGAAAVGGTYTLQGTAGNYDVANGSATIRVPAAGNTRAAMLNSTSQRDVDLRVRVSTDKVAAGGQYAMFAVARRNTNNEYRAKLIFNANGSVAVQASVVNNGKESPLGGAVTVSGLTQAADSYIWLRATVSGANPTAINVKAWKDGSAEPSGWQFSATDSTASVQGAGSVGLRLWLQGKVTNAPVTFRFDDYSALALN